ncbi:uncharacterized protein LOC135702598 [Ochlerotatus camptorhynchus]|uniref:uncharacterized protein LOC135702598 n=1 Tax=Ochlerotatus camptorhynchus TaxID=644619 RepID=UPI0031D92A08
MRCVACVFRFISNCRRKEKMLPIKTIKVTPELEKLLKTSLLAMKIPLKCEEHRQAENYMWKTVQQEGFSDEVKTLLKNRELPQAKWHNIAQSSSLNKLSPFLDEFGVIRMEGRSAHAYSIAFEQQFPIVLPKGHDVTSKLLFHYHRKFGHGNRETVVNEPRQRFYVQNIRAAVLQAMKSCAWCKINKCQPAVPRMAPLPVQRHTPQLCPFSYVGIVTVGRRSEKRLICLFTCLAARAIHMEVAHSLSDNGTNFQAASKELEQEVRRIDLECANVFTVARTQWTFNPPAALQMGGIWEGLESTVIEALTPNHFLRGLPAGGREEAHVPTNSAEALRDNYKRSQEQADMLWQGWLKEYIPTINHRTKWHGKQTPIQEGELVYVVDGNNRRTWIGGVGEKVIQGVDGRARRALDRACGSDDDIDAQKQRLVEMCEARIKELVKQQQADEQQNRMSNNDRVEALLQKLSESYSRYYDLIPGYCESHQSINVVKLAKGHFGFKLLHG